MSELVHVSIEAFNAPDLEARSAEIAAMVSQRAVRGLLNSRHQWTAIKNFRSVDIAHKTLRRAQEHQKDGKHDTLLALDTQTNATVGVGASIPVLPLRRLSIPIFPYPPLLKVPGIIQETGGVTGANVTAWVDNRRKSWLEETAAFYDELRQEAAVTSDSWTVEPNRTATRGLHDALNQAGFIDQTEGYFDDAELNSHVVPYSTLFVAQSIHVG